MPVQAAGTINLSLSQQFDEQGNPLSGCKLHFFQVGTTTPQNAVAKTYVTLEAQKIIKEAIDERGDHLEAAVNKLSDAVDRMDEKHDRSIGKLVKALTAKS